MGVINYVPYKSVVAGLRESIGEIVQANRGYLIHFVIF